jgi:hypothetical protein
MVKSVKNAYDCRTWGYIEQEHNNYFLFVNLFGNTFTSNLWLKLLD